MTLTDLQATAPDADLQVVTDAKNIEQRKSHSSDNTSSAEHQEPRPRSRTSLVVAVAWLSIAGSLSGMVFRLTRAGSQGEPHSPRIRRWGWYRLLWGLPVLLTVIVLGTVLHAAITGEFLGFLPQSWRLMLEQQMGVPPAVPGEGTRWRLEKMPYLSGDARLDRWLVGGTIAFAVVYIASIYRRERIGSGESARPRRFFRHPLTGLASLRLGIVLLTLTVLLPQIQLAFERKGWPDIVIVFDDSRSMSIVDSFHDPLIREKADKLKKEWSKLAAPRIETIQRQIEELQRKLASQPSSVEAARLHDDRIRLEAHLHDLRTPHRLNLIKALLASSSQNWLKSFLTDRQMRVHLYRVSSQTTRIAELTDPSQCERMLDEIIDIVPAGESSRLGDAVESILKTFRGGSLNAIIMLTDGVTTAGEDLPRAGRTATQDGGAALFCRHRGRANLPTSF